MGEKAIANAVNSPVPYKTKIAYNRDSRQKAITITAKIKQKNNREIINRPKFVCAPLSVITIKVCLN